MTVAGLAKDLGATVLSTTRRPDRSRNLKDNGVEYVLIDNGEIAAGTIKLATPKVYNFTQEEVRQAHDDMENNRVVGKLVVKIA